MLLYLNKETFLHSVGDKLAHEVRVAMSNNIHIVMVWENDPDRGGCQFSAFMQSTPEDLIRDGLYKKLAISCLAPPLRTVSHALIAKGLGASTATGIIRTSVRRTVNKAKKTLESAERISMQVRIDRMSGRPSRASKGVRESKDDPGSRSQLAMPESPPSEVRRLDSVSAMVETDNDSEMMVQIELSEVAPRFDSRQTRFVVEATCDDASSRRARSSLHVPAAQDSLGTTPGTTSSQ